MSQHKINEVILRFGASMKFSATRKCILDSYISCKDTHVR